MDQYQLHGKCSVEKCLQKQNDGQLKCRAGYPRSFVQDPYFEKNGKFIPTCNHKRIVNYNAYILAAAQANAEIQNVYNCRETVELRTQQFLQEKRALSGEKSTEGGTRWR